MNQEITITALKSDSSPETCEEFLDSHNSVLNNLGYKQFYPTSNDYWLYQPNIYVITARDQNNKLLGGARLEIGDHRFNLPFEKSIRNAENSLLDQIDNWIDESGCAEICSLWISKEGFKIGLKSEHLILSAIGLMKQLKISIVISISITSIKNPVYNIGGRKLDKFGDNGFFPFMEDRKVSIDHFEYPTSLKLSKTKYEVILRELFERNTYEETSNFKGGNLKVIYSLQL